MKEMLKLPGGSPKTIVDIGCAAGLSTFALMEVRSFQNAPLILSGLHFFGRSSVFGK